VISVLQEIWTEKYRPMRLDEMIGQRNIIERLRCLVVKKSLPHMLFAGPAGVGKTTAALCLANEFWKDAWKGNFLELNASDERGIDTIRNKVKEFARTMALSGGFKIVYLDEADALTRDAQQALRRVMEIFSDSCRFILACNYSSRIIPPIQSRCAIFRFSPLKPEDVVQYLGSIAAAENVAIEHDALVALHETSGGDLRRAVNMFQSAAFDGTVTEQKIYELSSKDPEKVRMMVNNSLDGNFKEARALLISLLGMLSGEDVVKEIHNQITDILPQSEKKLDLLERLCECEWRIVDGADPRIQLEGLLAWMAVKCAKG
jgi:replication factor C small subunit